MSFSGVQNRWTSTPLWDFRFHYHRFKHDTHDALNQLKRIERDTPRPYFTAMVGRCLMDLHEYEEAQKRLEEAAKTALGPFAYQCRLDIAKCGLMQGWPDQAVADLCQLGPAEDNAGKQAFLSILQDALTKSRETVLSLAVGEVLLRCDPVNYSRRFQLGLGYIKADYYGPAITHYRMLQDENPDDSGVLHNLGLASSHANLPFLAVANYKRAVELGSTLSASNLGHICISAGLEEEAANLLKSAMESGDNDPAVAECFGRLAADPKMERERLTELVDEADKLRAALVMLGEGYITRLDGDVSGKWAFETLDIAVEIAISGAQLSGVGNKGLGTMAESIEVKLSGKLFGRVCQFSLEVKRQGGLFGAILGSHGEITDGFILFSPDARSGRVIEVKDGKLKQSFDIHRTE